MAERLGGDVGKIGGGGAVAVVGLITTAGQCHAVQGDGLANADVLGIKGRAAVAKANRVTCLDADQAAAVANHRSGGGVVGLVVGGEAADGQGLGGDRQCRRSHQAGDCVVVGRRSSSERIEC